MSEAKSEIGGDLAGPSTSGEQRQQSEPQVVATKDTKDPDQGMLWKNKGLIMTSKPQVKATLKVLINGLLFPFPTLFNHYLHYLLMTWHLSQIGHCPINHTNQQKSKYQLNK